MAGRKILPNCNDITAFENEACCTTAAEVVDIDDAVNEEIGVGTGRIPSSEYATVSLRVCMSAYFPLWSIQLWSWESHEKKETARKKKIVPRPRLSRKTQNEAAKTHMESVSDNLTSSIVGFSAVGPMVHTISSFSGSQQAAVMSGCRHLPNRRLRRLRIVKKRLGGAQRMSGREKAKALVDGLIDGTGGKIG